MILEIFILLARSFPSFKIFNCQLNVLGNIFSILKKKGFQEKHFGGQDLVQKTHRVLGQRYASKQKYLSLKCSWLTLFLKVTTKWNPMLIFFSWRNCIPQEITHTRQQTERNTSLFAGKQGSATESRFQRTRVSFHKPQIVPHIELA